MTLQVRLIPDEPDQWVHEVEDKDEPEKAARDLPAVRTRFAQNIREWVELVGAGACHRCCGSRFYETPKGSGNWLCARCYPPIGTRVRMCTTYKPVTGPRKVVTAYIG